MENSVQKTQEQLIREIEELREKIAEFESLKTKVQSSENKKTSFWKKLSKKEIGTNNQVSDDTFRLIAKNTSDAISLHTFNLTLPYTYVSPAMAALSGYDVKYLLGKSPFDFMHPDDKKELLSILKDYVNKRIKKIFKGTETGVSEKIEFRFKHKSGRWIYLHSTGNISNKQVLFVSRDVTEQIQIQQALIQSENKYRQLFDQTADPTLIIKDNKFVDCNEATVIMLGYRNKDELLNKHPSEISPQYQPNGEPSFEKANEMMSIAFTNGSHRFEWDHKKRDDKVLPVEVLLTAIQIDEEKFLHCVWRDISIQKLSERELGKSEERFKRLFEDLGSAVYVTKIGGANAGQIIEANNAAVKQTGYTIDELLTMNIIHDFKVIESGDMNTENLEDKLLKGETITAVEKKRRKNGSEYWTEVIVTLIEYKKEHAGLSINHDITKRKYAEDALRSIATQFSAITGFDFIEKVCKHITQTLNIEYAFAGILSSNKEKVIVKAGIGIGKPIKQFEYLLKDTPCKNVIEKSACYYPTDVQKSFPEDFLLKEMNIDSYMGIPLFNSSGDPIGIMVLLDSKPMDNEEVASSLLQIFSDRIAAEMERMDTEEELRISEEKFRNLYKNSPIMLHSIDREGRLISVSNHWLKIMGYSEEEVIGVNSTEFLTEASKEYAINEILPNFFITGIINDVPYEYVRKDGEIINVLMSAISEKNQLGEVVRSIAVLVDVTEVRKSQMALLETDSLLRKSQKVASLGTYVLDIKTGNWQSSTILDDIFGIDTNRDKNVELWVNIVHEDDRDMMQNYFATNVLKNHEPFNKEYRIRRIDDHQVRWVHGHGELEFDKDGNPIKMIGPIQDITKRKLVEDSLTQERQRLSYILEGTNAGTWDWNVQTGELTLNNRWAEIMGYTLEELEPIDVNTWRDNVHPDDLLKANASNEKHRKGETDYYEVEFRQPHKDGTWVWVNARGKVTEWTDNGEPLRMSGTHMDITERKRVEQIQKVILEISKYSVENIDLRTFLEKIHNQINTILLAQNFYVALYDKLTNTYTFPYFVDETETYEGGEPEELEGSFTDLVRRSGKGKLITEEVEKELRKHEDIILIGFPSSVWVGAPLVSGSSQEVIGVLVLQDYKNKDAYTAYDLEVLEIIAFNIGMFIERKQNIDDLTKTKEKATESDRLKSAFLATMSHELRTPLNAIIGFTNLISEDIPYEEALIYNKIVNASGNHLLTIVEDLFDITLIEAGEIKIHNQQEDIHAILGEVYDIIKGDQQITKKQHLDLSLIMPEGRENLITITDSVKLKQILINLLKNALKFTPEGHVHFGYEIEKENDQHLIKFFVEDTGIGISKEKQELIFDVFRQVEDSHTRIYGGTGIGLSIARKLTNLLGGSIWLESDIATVDKKSGTTFYFTIPFEEIETANEPTSLKVIKEVTRKNDTNKEKIILIVEDDKDSYDFLNIVCSTAKIHTLWAQDGKEAVEICKENADIDLVLMDINLPVMNGYEATKEIKKFNPELLIIAQTAYAISGDREKAIEVGCDDYISKPIKRDELMIKINKLLG